MKKLWRFKICFRYALFYLSLLFHLSRWSMIQKVLCYFPLKTSNAYKFLISGSISTSLYWVLFIIPSRYLFSIDFLMCFILKVVLQSLYRSSLPYTFKVLYLSLQGFNLSYTRINVSFLNIIQIFHVRSPLLMKYRFIFYS